MEDKKLILVVDDSETNIDILVELLGDRYAVMVALDGKSALNVIKEENIDLILLDILMPNMDGYEVCQILKSNDETKDIPIIFITSKTDEDSIEKAYDVGGLDYITKPFKSKELLARVKTQLDLRKLINHLEFISSYDPMTGIYNRRKFFELGESRFKNNSENIFAVMIDIDKFKKINDTYGHPIGDKVIEIVAKTINEMIDKKSVFGRVGGEEFVLLDNIKSIDTILENVEDIRKKIANLIVLSDDNKPITFTISQGIAINTKDINNLDALLKEADIALYEAKNSGRDRVIIRD